MLQNLVVYLIVSISILYTLYVLIKSLRTKEKSACEGCNGCEVKNQLKNNSATIINNKTCGTKY